jgi:hypothetical protein
MTIEECALLELQASKGARAHRIKALLRRYSDRRAAVRPGYIAGWFIDYCPR